MGGPVVHFEIIGPDPGRLRAYYGALFDWRFHEHAPVAPEVSDVDQYAFVERTTTPDGTGIPGGIGGGDAFDAHALFYVGVPDVAAALERAEALGGVRVLGPVVNAEGGVVVGHFRDPSGTLVGVAGPA